MFNRYVVSPCNCLCIISIVYVFCGIKEEDPALHHLQSEDLHTTAMAMADTKATLYELVAQIEHVSTT